MTAVQQVMCEHLTSLVRFSCLQGLVSVFTVAPTHRLMPSFGAQPQPQPFVPTVQKSVALWDS